MAVPARAAVASSASARSAPSTAEARRRAGAPPSARVRALAARTSESIHPHLAGADPHDLFGGHHPDLAVADRPGPGARHDRLDDVVDLLVVDRDLEPGLRDELHLVLGAAVDLGVAALPAEAADLRDAQPLDTDTLEGLLHLFELERLDDRDDQLHEAESPWGTRTGWAGGGVGAGAPCPATGANPPAPSENE